MHIKIILERSEEGGYTASVPALPGCISEGDSGREVMRISVKPRILGVRLFRGVLMGAARRCN